MMINELLMLPRTGTFVWIHLQMKVVGAGDELVLAAAKRQTQQCLLSMTPLQ